MTLRELERVYDFIPLDLTADEYQNILIEIKNSLKKNNIQDKTNFLKNKIIKKIFCKRYDFKDNIKNACNLDVINLDLNLFMDIKVNPNKYGKDGNTYKNKISNDKEFLSFYEKNIYKYQNVLNIYANRDFYIGIYSEPDNKMYYINFYKLYDLYKNKNFEQFETISGVKSSLFFEKQYFMEQNDFDDFLKKKSDIRRYLDNNFMDIRNSLENYIKFILFDMQICGLEVDLNVRVPYIGKVKHLNNVHQLIINDEYTSVKGFFIHIQKDELPVYYFNDKKIQNEDMFYKIMKLI